jgi:hypothetical protein
VCGGGGGLLERNSDVRCFFLPHHSIQDIGYFNFSIFVELLLH